MEMALGEFYEEQYDPNQEFRIFGIGDKTRGGIQTMQEKMNMADEVEGEEQSSDTDNEAENPSTNYAPAGHATAGKATGQSADVLLSVPGVTPVKYGTNEMDCSIRSSNMTNEHLLIQEQTPMGSFYSSEAKPKADNALPED